MKVVFSPRSIARLREIQSYIAYDNVIAAASVVSRILHSAEMLADYPELGPTWKDRNTRALNVSGLPYRIHYRINAGSYAVEVITVAHTRQKPPKV